MATLAPTSLSQSGPFLATQIILGASDTFTYVQGVNSKLILQNPTAGSLTITIDGASGTTVDVPGTGTTFSVAAGLAVTVAAGTTKVVRLDTIPSYLQGIISVTGGTGAVAILLA